MQLLFTRLPSFSEEPQGEDDASVDQVILSITSLLHHCVRCAIVTHHTHSHTCTQTLTCEGTGEDDFEEPDEAIEEDVHVDPEAEEPVKPERQVLELPEPPVSTSKHKHGPYGVPCCRELLRFLISIINAHDRSALSCDMHMTVR